MTRARYQRLSRDRRGAALIEFALVAPVMIMLMMGLGDLLYQIYAQSVLTGAVQKAARDSGIEGGAANAGTLDTNVINIISPLIKNLTVNCAANPPTSTWCSKREYYDNFADVPPEPFVDTNGNGTRDAGECFTDLNGNGTWDLDRGDAGQGGANSVALYTMRITYPRLFPVASLLGWSPNQTITSTSLLKNQPYASQTLSGDPDTNVQICN